MFKWQALLPTGPKDLPDEETDYDFKCPECLKVTKRYEMLSVRKA